MVAGSAVGGRIHARGAGSGEWGSVIQRADATAVRIRRAVLRPWMGSAGPQVGSLGLGTGFHCFCFLFD